MHPELIHFHYFGAEKVFYSYGLMIVLGMTAALLVGVARARRYRLERFDVFAIGVLCCCGGIAGGWLLYVAIHFHEFLAEPTAFVRTPGMVFYGGFLGATAIGAWYARRYRVSLAAVADVGAVALPVGHALGRVGCFLGGCCYGRPTTSRFGVLFLDPRAPATALSRVAGRLHPVQLYESAGLLTIALALLAVERSGLLSRRARGSLFAVYMLLYALLRLAMESLRADSVERGTYLGISTSEAIAGVMIAVALALLLRRAAPPKEISG